MSTNEHKHSQNCCSHDHKTHITHTTTQDAQAPPNVAAPSTSETTPASGNASVAERYTDDMSTFDSNSVGATDDGFELVKVKKKGKRKGPPVQAHELKGEMHAAARAEHAAAEQKKQKKLEAEARAKSEEEETPAPSKLQNLAAEAPAKDEAGEPIALSQAEQREKKTAEFDAKMKGDRKNKVDKLAGYSNNVWMSERDQRATARKAEADAQARPAGASQKEGVPTQPEDDDDEFLNLDPETLRAEMERLAAEIAADKAKKAKATAAPPQRSPEEKAADVLDPKFGTGEGIPASEVTALDNDQTREYTFREPHPRNTTRGRVSNPWVTSDPNSMAVNEGLPGEVIDPATRLRTAPFFTANNIGKPTPYWKASPLKKQATDRAEDSLVGRVLDEHREVGSRISSDLSRNEVFGTVRKMRDTYIGKVQQEMTALLRRKQLSEVNSTEAMKKMMNHGNEWKEAYEKVDSRDATIAQNTRDIADLRRELAQTQSQLAQTQDDLAQLKFIDASLWDTFELSDWDPERWRTSSEWYQPSLRIIETFFDGPEFSKVEENVQAPTNTIDGQQNHNGQQYHGGQQNHGGRQNGGDRQNDGDWQNVNRDGQHSPDSQPNHTMFNDRRQFGHGRGGKGGRGRGGGNGAPRE